MQEGSHIDEFRRFLEGYLEFYEPFQNAVCPRSTVGMSRHDVTDEPWAMIAPFIPTQNAGPGRKRHDDRSTRNGILFVLKTGCTWEDVPRVDGSPATYWRRFRPWSADGTWERMWRMLLRRLDGPGQLEGA